MYALPFAAKPDAEGYYLIERHALYMAPSVAAVVALEQRATVQEAAQGTAADAADTVLTGLERSESMDEMPEEIGVRPRGLWHRTVGALSKRGRSGLSHQRVHPGSAVISGVLIVAGGSCAARTRRTPKSTASLTQASSGFRNPSTADVDIYYTTIGACGESMSLLLTQSHDLTLDVTAYTAAVTAYGEREAPEMRSFFKHEAEAPEMCSFFKHTGAEF